jgi:hypothetical protein
MMDSTHQDSQQQGDAFDDAGNNIYDMVDYDIASIFKEQEDTKFDDIIIDSYGDSSDIDDHSTTMSDIAD